MRRKKAAAVIQADDQTTEEEPAKLLGITKKEKAKMDYQST